MTTNRHDIGSREAWVAARRDLLQREKELPGLSAFALQDGAVHHTYSAYARGGEPLMGIYQLLDRAPRGRDEDELPWPMAWVRRHDQYERVAAG